MASRCDLALFDHYNEDGDLVARCSDAEHCAAIVRRSAGAPKWNALERRRQHGDLRDYLDGKPISCGTGLELQAREYKEDDYGEYILYLPTGVPVRYELAWPPGADDRKVVLHGDLGGYEFTMIAGPWMRFRRPQRGGR